MAAIISIDMHEFTRAAAKMGRAAKGQVPFAIANTMNNALFDARKQIVGVTFPASFDVHNRSFARGSFRVDKASKGRLRGSLKDVLHRGSLEKHATSGTKTAKSGNLAIPAPVIAKFRKSRGIPKTKRPRKFKASKVIRITDDGIFRGEGGRLVPLYFFEKSVKLPKRFPFYEEFERVVVRTMRTKFPANLRRAILSAR